MYKKAKQFLKFAILVTISFGFSSANAQLNVLSAGNSKAQWRSTQLQIIDQQLADAKVTGPLRKELEAQKGWLSQWSAGKLTDSPWISQKQGDKLFQEPNLDPDKKAGALRQKLLGKGAKPTAKETEKLQEAMTKSPNDVGLKQLYLHWLDQKQYRAEYAPVVVQTATGLASQLESMSKSSEEFRLARAYCYYRAARAMIYMESPEYQANKPIEDMKEHEAKLLGYYSQLTSLVGPERPEFILVEIRMLCRDNWYGKALMLLEQSASKIEKNWYLQYRFELLTDLGWAQPAEEAETIALAANPYLDREARTAAGVK